MLALALHLQPAVAVQLLKLLQLCSWRIGAVRYVTVFVECLAVVNVMQQGVSG